MVVLVRGVILSVIFSVSVSVSVIKVLIVSVSVSVGVLTTATRITAYGFRGQGLEWRRSDGRRSEGGRIRFKSIRFRAGVAASILVGPHVVRGLCGRRRVSHVVVRRDGISLGRRSSRHVHLAAHIQVLTHPSARPASISEATASYAWLRKTG